MQYWMGTMIAHTLDTNLYALMYKFVVEPRRMYVVSVPPYSY